MTWALAGLAAGVILGFVLGIRISARTFTAMLNDAIRTGNLSVSQAQLILGLWEKSRNK